MSRSIPVPAVAFRLFAVTFSVAPLPSVSAPVPPLRITFPADDVASVSVQETVQVSRQGIESRRYVLLVCSKTSMKEIRMAIGARRPPMDGDRVCTAMMALVRPPA